MRQFGSREGLFEVRLIEVRNLIRYSCINLHSLACSLLGLVIGGNFGGNFSDNISGNFTDGSGDGCIGI